VVHHRSKAEDILASSNTSRTQAVHPNRAAHLPDSMVDHHLNRAVHPNSNMAVLHLPAASMAAHLSPAPAM